MEFGLAMWSLHRAFREGGLDLTAAPAAVAERTGIRLLDPTYPLMDLADDGKRGEFVQAAADAGCRIHTIAVGGCGDLSAADKAERLAAIDQHKPWFERCREAGAFAFRANTGGQGKERDGDTIARCMESFAALADLGRDSGVKVLIENHGGVSTNAPAVQYLIAAINSPWVATVPDFGNFPEASRYEDLAILMTLAAAVHAKTKEFDAEGRHTSWDLKRCLALVRDSGYSGPLSIEFEGPIGGAGQPKDEFEGIVWSRKALEASV